MSKRPFITIDDENYPERTKYIVDGHPYDSLWTCANSFYNNFQFKNKGAATDAFRANLRKVDKEQHKWIEDFLREIESPEFLENERKYFQEKRRQRHTMEAFTQQLSRKVQKSTLESSTDLLLAGNVAITRETLAGLGVPPSRLLKTPSRHSESESNNSEDDASSSASDAKFVVFEGGIINGENLLGNLSDLEPANVVD
ncbi:hypothetical protein BGX26_002109 [Mortierella sp. AD094]|nr:hypothetical protein BGX26_002109 [Mortierella sp. AD094]